MKVFGFGFWQARLRLYFFANYTVRLRAMTAPKEHISELHSCVADELCGRKEPSKKAPKKRKKKSKINQTPDTCAKGPSMSVGEKDIAGGALSRCRVFMCVCG